MDGLDFNSTLVSVFKVISLRDIRAVHMVLQVMITVITLLFFWKNKTKVLLRDEIYIRFVQILWLVMMSYFL